MSGPQDDAEESPRQPVDREWIKHDVLRKRSSDRSGSKEEDKPGDT